MATVTAKNFNAQNITVTDPKAIEINGKTIGAKQSYINYAGGRLVLQSAKEMGLPFGVSVYDEVDPPKYSLDLSFRDYKTNGDMKAFYDALRALDDKMIQLGVENSKKWFKAELNYDQVKSMKYKSCLREAKDKEGNPLDYPPTLKINLKKRRDKQGNDLGFGIDAVDSKREAVDTSDIEKGWGKGQTVTALLECGGMWLSTVGYGITWRIKKLMLHKDAKKGGDYDFVMDEEEDAEEHNEEAAAGAGGRSNSKKHDNFIDDDASPPPAPKKASALTAVMPQPESNPFENVDMGENEEDTVPPAEVPKKPVVKKKVVPKKTA
jgi:hypothetical protein